MFRKEFADVISKTGMVPVKDLRPLFQLESPNIISEFGLLDLGFFDDIKFAKQVSHNHKLPFIDLSRAKVKDRTLKLIKKQDATRFRVVPIKKSGQAVTVAIYDPSIVDLQVEIQKVFQHPVQFVVTGLKAWKRIYNKLYESVDELLYTIKEIKEVEIDQGQVTEEDIGDEVIRFVNKFLAESFVRQASDIHIEPYEKNFRIRFRIDGTLMEYEKPPRNLMLPIISRIKIMAKLDISERRKPQDGRIKLSIGGRPIDYRVSSLPTLFGEKIVLRLLDSSNLELDMTKLGLEKNQLKVLKQSIHQPYGMVLVTGPTGSGKTTTLYSSMYELNKVGKNLSTVEDPVEFNLEGINQVNIRKEAGLTFPVALKAFLRQDPDIIMVGEIRDSEVGEIAIEAALTGHLVLSTLHTNDAPSTVTRLINMGIENFLVTASLNCAIAQRLCRRICLDCKTVDESITPEELVFCGIAPSSAQKIKVYKGSGCEACGGTGYKGRVAIFEVMEMTPLVKEIILRNGSTDDIKKQAIRDGMKTLRMAALTKVALGITTITEAINNSASDKF